MNVFNISISTLVIVALSACSTSNGTKDSDSKVFDYKAPPVKAQPLEVPPDLTSYSSGDRYGIPGADDSVTSYSEFSKGGANRKESSVLPPVKNVRLERKDNRRWLVVNDTAENIWPVVKAFWIANGLEIKIENPQAGVIETEWAANRAKIPMDAFRKYLSKVFEPSSSERDQYHTRLERSKDGKSTEIYITHYGMQEFVEKDETGYRWLPRPSDPELEATMLQLLMSKLGGGSGVLDNTQKLPETTAVDAGAAPALNKLADGSQRILLSEPFDKSWRKVGLALEQAGIALADKDRSKGVYYLSADKVERIQVTVRELSTGCEVLVKNSAGISNAETQKIVDSLFKTLGRL